MAISLRGTATGTVIDGGTVSVTLSGISGLAEGDVVVLCGQSSGGNVAGISGWTPATTATSLGQVFYKVMGASPDSSVTLWDSGTTSDAGAAVALAFSGVDTANVLDVSSPTPVSANNAAADPPAITPATDNACIVVFCNARTGSSAADTAIGNISGYTTSVTAYGNDTNDAFVAAFYNILTGGAGVSQNPATPDAWSPPGSSACISHTLALRALVPGQPAVKRLGGVKYAADYRKRGGGLWREMVSGLLVPRRQIWV